LPFYNNPQKMSSGCRSGGCHSWNQRAIEKRNLTPPPFFLPLLPQRKRGPG
jgi:hypothetical protein